MQKMPDGLNERAAAIWREITERYELDAHEIALLGEVCRTVTTLDILAERVDQQGTTIANRPNPALAEQRQQRIALARLITALRLPDEETGVQPQRRGGARGVYAVR
ncbi:hypothetical protein [Streptomyces sp. NPDC001221]